MAVQFFEFQLAPTVLAVKTGMYRVPELLCSFERVTEVMGFPTLLDQE